MMEAMMIIVQLLGGLAVGLLAAAAALGIAELIKRSK